MKAQTNCLHFVQNYSEPETVTKRRQCSNMRRKYDEYATKCCQ